MVTKPKTTVTKTKSRKPKSDLPPTALPLEPTIWKRKRDHAELPCELTDAERLEKNDEQQKLIQEGIHVEEAKKEANAAHAMRLATITSRIRELSVQIQTRREYRDVQCEWQYGNPDEHHKKLVRLDTGATVRIEEIQGWERQADLPLNDTPKEKEKTAPGTFYEMPPESMPVLEERREDETLPA